MLKVLLYGEGAASDIRDLLSGHSVEKTCKKEELVLKALTADMNIVFKPKRRPSA